MSGFLAPEEYALVYALVPIPCVDLVVVYNNKFLLGMRLNEPEKGKWFLPGGRTLKNETLLECAVRKAHGELGIKASPEEFKLLTVLDYKSTHGPFSNDSLHCVNTIYLLKLSAEPKLKMDSQHSKLEWFSKIDPSWHPYVKEALICAGFDTD